MSLADIQHRFAFHAATTEEKKMEHSSVRFNCLALAEVLEQDLPAGREKACAITRLEEVMFWANAAVARVSEESTPSVGKIPEEGMFK